MRAGAILKTARTNNPTTRPPIVGTRKICHHGNFPATVVKCPPRSPNPTVCAMPMSSRKRMLP
jgi:hypothetical protein